MFKPAKKTMAYLKLAVQGVSGSGKTLSSLILASSIAGENGKIAVLDTENNSASLYSDKIAFDTVNLTAPFSPERYIEIVNAAVKAEYNVLVIDSISHEWHGQGGILEINEEKARALKGNSYMAWKDSKARHQKLIDVITQAPIHVIVTIRQKTEYEQTQDDNGRKVVRKVGLKAMQSPDIEYEFTVVFDLMHDIVMGRKPFSVAKDRTSGIFTDNMYLTAETGKKLIEWLNTCEKQDSINIYGEKYLSDETMADYVATITECQDVDVLRDYYAKQWPMIKANASAEQAEELNKLMTKRAAELKAATVEVANDE